MLLQLLLELELLGSFGGALHSLLRILGLLFLLVVGVQIVLKQFVVLLEFFGAGAGVILAEAVINDFDLG